MKNEEAIKGMKKGFRHALGARSVVFKAWNCLLVHCEWLFKFENVRNQARYRGKNSLFCKLFPFLFLFKIM